MSDFICPFCEASFQDAGGPKGRDVHMYAYCSDRKLAICRRCRVTYALRTQESAFCTACNGKRSLAYWMNCKRCKRPYMSTQYDFCGQCRKMCPVCDYRKNRYLNNLLQSMCPDTCLPLSAIQTTLDRLYRHTVLGLSPGPYDSFKLDCHFCPICGLRTLDRVVCAKCRSVVVHMYRRWITTYHFGIQGRKNAEKYLKMLHLVLGLSIPGQELAWIDPRGFQGITPSELRLEGEMTREVNW